MCPIGESFPAVGNKEKPLLIEAALYPATPLLFGINAVFYCVYIIYF
ncbi:hypothetical protein BACCIP111899_02493 [Bacillus rhizoplanae]|uniref:Uncharacterized protein n=1 Tax=Bacillus rhizoplanae TaxID=2880966 RepID=A0ABM8YBW7_9BACI|nr:hypothetical protein BACCIP111899_02493 [Bacillus rhizoplanae]